MDIKKAAIIHGKKLGLKVQVEIINKHLILVICKGFTGENFAMLIDTKEEKKVRGVFNGR